MSNLGHVDLITVEYLGLRSHRVVVNFATRVVGLCGLFGVVA